MTLSIGTEVILIPLETLYETYAHLRTGGLLTFEFAICDWDYKRIHRYGEVDKIIIAELDHSDNSYKLLVRYKDGSFRRKWMPFEAVEATNKMRRT